MILCADDFGLSPGVSNAILDLAEKERISAVTCIVTEKSSAEAFEHLKKFHTKIDIGLHLVVPHGETGRYRSIPSLLAPHFWVKAGADEIYATFYEQLLRFESLLGFAPDFVDGHRHIHQLPSVRAAYIRLLTHLQRRNHLVYARVGFMPAWLIRKNFSRSLGLGIASLTISSLGALLAQKVRNQRLFSNEKMLGYLKYESVRDFVDLLEACPSRTGPQDFLYCHPGWPDPALLGIDSLVDERAQIYEFLNSSDFSHMLESKKIEIHRYPFSRNE